MARRNQVLDRIRRFLATEASGGLVLLAATLAALIWANLLPGYDTIWDHRLGVAGVVKDLRHWVNDGLMTMFFFVVGLEIKRELVVGELRGSRVAALPVVAAVGGMVAPAVVYLAVNAGAPTMRGWAIPMATDIAFVVGALSLLGGRIPTGLKAFLLALAIVDDIGAIVVIAIGLTGSVEPRWLMLAVACLVLTGVLRLFVADKPLVYVAAGVVLWWCTLRSHIHPTLAGVALALIVPARPVNDRDVHGRLQEAIHPFSSFIVVPLFALANAGVVLDADTVGRSLGSRVFWGIVAGLTAGKTIGIVGASTAAERLRIGRRPDDVDRHHIVGGAVLSGIGFTVALFIAGLVFGDDAVVEHAKLGILAASVLAAAAGMTLLRRDRRPGQDQERLR
jgi:Na+:H+ antiporter, NhaA family